MGYFKMSKMEFLDPLEAEKLKKQKCVQFCGTPCIKSQSQNLIPILKVSVSVSRIETSYTESQSQSQHAKTGLAHPCLGTRTLESCAQEQSLIPSGS